MIHSKYFGDRPRWLGQLAAGLIFGVSSVCDAAWPTRPVRIVVPAPAGSSLDVIARIAMEKLQPMWQQPIVVENKPGAGGLIGVEAAVRTPADGHVLALGFNGPLAFAPYLYRSMPYDIRKDVLPVVLASSQPNVLAIHAALPVRSVRELIDWAKKPENKVTYASIGSGSSSHLTMELFRRQLGFDATHVPYNGSPTAALSVARGESQILFAVASGVLPQVQSGQVRLLAVTSAKRFEGMPDLPTLAESGMPGFAAEAWNGFVAAQAAPQDAVQRINADVNTVLKHPDVRKRLAALGMSPMGGTPESFRSLIESEMNRWGPVIQSAGIQAD